MYLTIQNANIRDIGKYTCAASNEAGVAEKRFHVDVRGISF